MADGRPWPKLKCFRNYPDGRRVEVGLEILPTPGSFSMTVALTDPGEATDYSCYLPAEMRFVAGPPGALLADPRLDDHQRAAIRAHVHQLAAGFS